MVLGIGTGGQGERQTKTGKKTFFHRSLLWRLVSQATTRPTPMPQTVTVGIGTEQPSNLAQSSKPEETWKHQGQLTAKATDQGWAEPAKR
jgi:hypothetical protein